MKVRIVVCALLTLIIALPSFAADPFSGTLRVRGENWNWFETPNAEDEYTFIGSWLRLMGRKEFGQVEGTLELTASALWNLPDNAVQPAPRGQLGLGASYFAANGEEDETGLFVKQAFLKRGGFRIGRFEFADGGEHMPQDPGLAALRRDRISHRLVGTFAFTHVGRSYDGVQYDGSQFTLLAARPTEGVFDIHGNRNLQDIDLVYGSWVRSSDINDARIFAIGYRDDRGLVKTDNRPAPVRNLDREEIEIYTIGGHYLHKQGIGDVVLWAATQFGDWGSLDHSAYAFNAEGGVQFERASVRGGWYRSSGDSDNADDDHDSFFQILPTPRIYARFPFYNAMNSNDVFLLLGVKPHAKVTLQSEIHRLSLTNDDDLWYAGGGAFEDESFGYAGRPSFGNNDLATVADLSVAVNILSNSQLTFYVGQAFGDDVIESIFAGDDATYAYVEALIRF